MEFNIGIGPQVGTTYAKKKTFYYSVERNPSISPENPY